MPRRRGRQMQCRIVGRVEAVRPAVLVHIGRHRILTTTRIPYIYSCVQRNFRPRIEGYTGIPNSASTRFSNVNTLISSTRS